MADVIFERVLNDARALSPGDQRRLIQLLAAQQQVRPHKSLEQLSTDQGKKPVNFDDLLKLGEFFPEDESVDDLVNFIRISRKDSQGRNIE
jgi:hypothetical protein